MSLVTANSQGLKLQYFFESLIDLIKVYCINELEKQSMHHAENVTIIIPKFGITTFEFYKDLLIFIKSEYFELGLRPAFIYDYLLINKLNLIVMKDQYGCFRVDTHYGSYTNDMNIVFGYRVNKYDHLKDKLYLITCSRHLPNASDEYNLAFNKIAEDVPKISFNNSQDVRTIIKQEQQIKKLKTREIRRILNYPKNVDQLILIAKEVKKDYVISLETFMLRLGETILDKLNTC
jgi:hypothetical protein